MSNKECKTDRSNKLELATILSGKLLGILKNEEIFLKQENKKITHDTLFSIDHDFEFIKRYLVEYIENSKDIFEKKLKAKGTVFIILSYNEPFILSVIPILNAILAGNSVVVKPSGKCCNFFKKIWMDSSLIDEFKLQLNILEKPDEPEINATIAQVDCVYFFGSFETAQRIYRICAELFVEFVPEVESADCKVFKFDQSSDDFLEKDCDSTLLQSFTHSGQVCQRISGVFVHRDNYAEYQDKIVEAFNKLTKKGIDTLLVENDFAVNELYQQKVLEDIATSIPSKIIGSEKHLAKIVIEPEISSKFLVCGYFYPVLWLMPFNDLEQLRTYLNDRRFYLGLNIQSDDMLFIDSLIEETKFTRYTVNVPHADIRPDEGWGGRWPSGSGGYKSWVEHFSVSYEVVTG